MTFDFPKCFRYSYWYDHVFLFHFSLFMGWVLLIDFFECWTIHLWQIMFGFGWVIDFIPIEFSFLTFSWGFYIYIHEKYGPEGFLSFNGIVGFWVIIREVFLTLMYKGILPCFLLVSLWFNLYILNDLIHLIHIIVSNDIV